MSPRKHTTAGAGDPQSFLRAVSAFVECNYPGSHAKKVTIRLADGEPIVLPITSSIRTPPPPARETVLDADTAEIIAATLTKAQRGIVIALRDAGRPMLGKQLFAVAGCERQFYDANRGLRAQGVTEKVDGNGYALTELGREVGDLVGDEAEDDQGA